MNQVQKQFKVILIGDDCIDEYQYGVVERISPEAPVPIFNYSHKEEKPGMAANVKENLERLGIFVVPHFGKPSRKIRIIDSHSKQHLLRIDSDVQSEQLDIKLDYKDIDAVVISDYNKGTVSYEFVERIIKEFKGPIFIDSKKTDLQRFEGAYLKINGPESKKLISKNTDLIITQGSKNVKYKDQEFVVPQIDVVDVCGAGDTFLSALVYKFITEKDIESAIVFAIRASAITVRKLGVYAPSLEDIK